MSDFRHFLQEGRELSEEVPDDAGLPDAVHRHHLLLLGHLLQGPPEQKERPAAHEVSCCFDIYSTCVFLSVRLRETRAVGKKELGVGGGIHATPWR